jgi:biopolymer transport protein ExbB/TolQ
MFKKNEITIITRALVVSSIFIVALNVLNYSTLSLNIKYLTRVFVLLGGDFITGGYIQWFTYVCGVWAFLEMGKLKKKNKAEMSYFKANLLPENEKHLLMAHDVFEIHQNIRDFEQKHSKTLLTQLIKNACAKFRSTKNISEVLDVINILTELHKDAAEMEQTNIRYLLWAIPSVGFIGTVIGISQALMVANSKDMNAITATLGVAFDTTLISLLLSIVLMWLYHDLQKNSDLFHLKSKEYVIENLVNKIEIN